MCGSLHCDQALFNPLLAALPRVLVVRPSEGATGRLLRSSLDFLSEELKRAAPDSETVVGRLCELLFVEALRHHIAQLPEGQRGWLAALKDRCVGNSLELIHADPAHPWTVEELARRSAVSRSGLAARFRELLGQPPAQYLTRWRLQLASRHLRDSDDGLARIAEAVGYASEAALSRAFKREVGRSPARFRKDCRS